jgi:hypothetical protein
LQVRTTFDRYSARWQGDLLRSMGRVLANPPRPRSVAYPRRMGFELLLERELAPQDLGMLVAGDVRGGAYAALLAQRVGLAQRPVEQLITDLQALRRPDGTADHARQALRVLDFVRDVGARGVGALHLLLGGGDSAVALTATSATASEAVRVASEQSVRYHGRMYPKDPQEVLRRRVRELDRLATTLRQHRRALAAEPLLAGRGAAAASPSLADLDAALADVQDLVSCAHLSARGAQLLHRKLGPALAAALGRIRSTMEEDET